MFQVLPTRKPEAKPTNPTNGSWWMVQILPTRKPAPKPTNPTNGSWWMVQIQPIKTCSETNKSHQRQFVDGSDPTYKDLLRNQQIPPTAVGGWFRSCPQKDVLRNQQIPPTAVGGWFRSNL